MDEKTAGKKNRGGIFWLLVLLAVILVWWFFRPSSEMAAAPWVDTGDIALLGDPDDILVDLDDDASAAQVAALEKDLGIDLELVSPQSADEQFYRAHVDPMRRDALIAELGRRPLVEIAEPDALYGLSPDDPILLQDLQDDECITVSPVPIDTAFAMIDRGEIADAKSMLALLLARRRGLI